MLRFPRHGGARCCFAAVFALVGLGLVAHAESPNVTLDEAFETLKTWEAGDDPAHLEFLHDYVVEAINDPEKKEPLEDRFIDVLENGSTEDAKAFACRQLFFFGTERSAPALAALLNNERLSHMARGALQEIPGATATDALIGALMTVNDTQRIGVIHSLGVRRDVEAIDPLTWLARRPGNDAVASAAVTALARFDSDQAVDAIRGLRQSVEGDMRAVVADAYMEVAERKHAQGDASAAADIYWSLYDPAEPVMHRVGALQGLSRVRGAEAAPVLLEAVLSRDAQIREAAVTGLREAPGVTEAIAEAAPEFHEPVQLQLIAVLGDRGDAAAIPVLEDLIHGAGGEVRDAAFDALAQAGDASVVPMLLELALADDAHLRGKARETLIALAGSDVDEAILAELDSLGVAGQVALLEVLGERHARNVTPAALAADWASASSDRVRVEVMAVLGGFPSDESLEVLSQAAGDNSPLVRRAALEALAGWPDDAPMDHLADAAGDAPTASERAEALRGYIRMIGMEDRSADTLAEHYGRALALAEQSSDKIEVLELLGEVRGEAALEVAERYVDDDEVGAAAQDAVDSIRALLAGPESVSASVNEGDAGNAIDGDASTRWGTGGSQEGGEWFQLDFGGSRAFASLTLDTSDSPNDYPRGYEVFVGDDPEDFGDPVVEGEGDGEVTVIELNGASGRYLRIVQTGSAEGNWWSIHELSVEIE